MGAHRLRHPTVQAFGRRALAVAASQALLMLSAGVALLAGAPAQAQAGAKAYSIPAGSLESVLTRYALESGVMLSYAAGDVAGRRSPGLDGSYPPQAALSAILSGTGLHASAMDNGGYVLRLTPPATPPATPAATGAALPAVKVTAKAVQAGTGQAEEGYRVKDSGIAGFGNQALLDTPFSVSVLSSELLTNQKIEDVGLLDRIEASVTASAGSPGTYSQTYVRGLALNSYSNYWHNGLTFLNFQLVGLENKERVEVLSGLSALQAGFSSPGGIINYVTKRPAPDAVSDLSFSVDQRGDAKAGVDLSRRTEDGRFGLRVNAATQKLRSFVEGADGQRTLLALAADWQLTPDTLLKLDLEHERRAQAFQALLFQNVDGQLPRNVDPRRFLGQDWAEVETRYTMASGKLDQRLGEDWSQTLEGNWARQEREQHTIILDALQPGGDADVYNFFAPAQRYTPATARGTVRGRFATGPVAHELAFGLSYMRTATRWADYSFDPAGTTNIYAPRVLPAPTYQTGPINLIERIREQGVFFNDILSLADAWKLHLGGRYVMRKQTSYDATGAVDGTPYDKSVFTPSLALVFKPRPEVSTYVSYIEGLENGGTAPLLTENQNRQLDPLTSKQVEAGVKAELGKLLLQAALFQIDRAAEYVNSANVFVQDGNQRHRGLQLSLSGKLAPEWTVFGSALLMDAKLKDTGDEATRGKRPWGVPRQRLALVAEYAPRAWPDWVFGGNWTYTGNRELTPRNTGDAAPGYSLVGIGVRHEAQVGGTPVTLRLNVDNLFDRFYWASANGAVVAGSPRTVSAGVTIRF